MNLPVNLVVDLDKALGGFHLSAQFESGGGVTALFGRSGSGKTTLVNLIAGLTRPDRGTIRIGRTVLFDSGNRIDVPVHRRAIGYVFQDGRLFPHLSVRSNLLYGQRFGRRRAAGGDLGRIAGLLDIAPLLDRRPADLSGGEKQRVAIGRALLSEPRLLLMDEPLAALDAARKAEILPYIERLRDEIRLPVVYVSHAEDEVARLADTLVLLADGKVVATGGVNEVFGRLDLGAYSGRFEAGTVLTARIVIHDTSAGLTTLDHPAGRLTVPLMAGAPGTTVRVRIRARDVALAVGEPGRISIRNRLAGTVAEIDGGAGPAVDVRLDVGGEALVARVTQGAVAALGLAAGTPVTALVKATAFDTAD